MDVGLCLESRWLSNLRLAPIQVTGYGHPVSAFGSQIDYFIGGSAVELPDRAAEHYAERLVLIPGLAICPAWPDYERRRPARPSEPVVVNCPWSVMKTNYPLLASLRDIARSARRKVVFQFFPAWSADKCNGFVPFRQDVESVLGAQAVRMVKPLPPAEYLAAMETAHFSLDSYPYGGFNTVIDQFCLGQPFVTQEGNRYFNRAAAVLLRKLGLDELVARDAAQYVAIAARLVDDEPWRADLARQVEAADVRSLFDPAEARHFKTAIDYLIANHSTLQADPSRKPIVIAP